MNRRVVIAPVIAISLALAIGAVPVTAEAATKKPSKISSVKARPGPGAGQITITWKSKGKNTNHFRIETALSNFNPSKSSKLPAHGRNATMWGLSPKARSVTISRSTMAKLGAPLASGSHLYFRITPYNRGSSGWKAGSGAKTKSMYPRAQAPTGRFGEIRVASFNVRSAPSTIGTSRSWPSRATKVAQTIVSKRPGIVLLQEVSPGAVTGKSGTPRQTEDLVAKLRANGGSRYAMVRTTPYVKAGTTMGSQGARIVYDTTKYRLLSTCPEKTGKRNFNGSCAVIEPNLPGESAKHKRPAAVARFRDKASGRSFWAASVHLDNRDGVKYENLRATQVRTVTNAIAAANPGKWPVILGGDFNAWQNNDPYSYAPHNVLIKDGFYDMAAAVTKVNMRYGTMNHFDTTMRPSASVHGSRLDVIVAKGVTGSSRFENVLAVKDAKRASDHNMIVATFRL